MKRASLIVLCVLFLDQFIKLWVKTHMYPGEEIRFTNWFIIHFTENNGMAFGLEFGGVGGKIFLSIFRIIASFGIGWYLVHLIRTRIHSSIIVAFSLIFAGAIGNIIDSAVYGLIFTNDYDSQAKLVAPGSGYAGFLHGRVVDMFYFPIISGTFPSWFPVWGGESFLFFRPIFNLADASITVGVILFIIVQKRFSNIEKAKLPGETVSETDSVPGINAVAETNSETGNKIKI